MRARSSSRANTARNTRTARYEIITFEGGFHGRTLATMSASGKKAFEPLFEPKGIGLPQGSSSTISSPVKALISDNTVAVMLEPIQGEAGVWPATDQFLQELRALTKEHGLLLIVDEIQTGMGRTGKLFHYEHAGHRARHHDARQGHRRRRAAGRAARDRACVVLRTRRPGRHLQRQSVDVRGGLAVLEARRQSGISEIGRGRRPVPGKRIAEAVGAAWPRRGPRPGSVARARSQTADRRRDRGARRLRTACSSTRRSPMRCASCRRSTSRARRYR